MDSPINPAKDFVYCCPMRRHFLVGIIKERDNEPAPIEVADFVVCFEPQTIIAIKYCPFCGVAIDGKQQLGTVL